MKEEERNTAHNYAWLRALRSLLSLASITAAEINARDRTGRMAACEDVDVMQP